MCCLRARTNLVLKFVLARRQQGQIWWPNLSWLGLLVVWFISRFSLPYWFLYFYLSLGFILLPVLFISSLFIPLNSTGVPTSLFQDRSAFLSSCWNLQPRTFISSAYPLPFSIHAHIISAGFPGYSFHRWESQIFSEDFVSYFVHFGSSVYLSHESICFFFFTQGP